MQLAISSSAANLDTVMYLYRRAPGAEGWGNYIARNDDSGDKMTSALDESLDAGEYRVLVKGYKRLIRGSFSLQAGCSGAGCAAGPVCSDQIAALPSSTGLGASCVDKLQGVLTSKVLSSNSSRVARRQRCTQPEIVRIAWDYYYSYFDDCCGIEQWFEDDDEEVTFNIRVTNFKAGTLVVLDMGGDEDGLRFLFNKNGKLLAYYQDNQSPDWAYHCKDPGEPAQNFPINDDYCLGHYLSNMSEPGPFTDTGVGAATMTEAEGTLPAIVQAAMTEYVSHAGLGAGDAMDYRYDIWNGRDGDDLAQVTIVAAGEAEMEYVVGQSWSDEFYIYLSREDGGEDSFLCK